jgi:hypothetical protein
MWMAYSNQTGIYPNVPSASEVKEKGLNLVGKADQIVAKIEELTMYNDRVAAID